MAVKLVRIVAITIVMAVALAATTREPSDAVSVTSPYILRVDELRDDGMHRSASSTAILELHGALLKKSAACANISIEKAIDEAGANLANLNAEAFKSNVESQRIRLCSLPGDVPAAQINVDLGPLSKGARKLSRLKGRLQLMVLSDETRELTIPHLKSCLHTLTPVPQLATDRIELHVFATPKRVAVFSDGNTSIMKEMDIDDSNGKTIARGVFDNGANAMSKCDFILPRDLDDRMSLWIQYAAKYRIVSVPFDLKDFPDP